MSDTLINDTLFIVLQTVLSSGNQIAQGNQKVRFQFQCFFIIFMTKLYIHGI